MRWRNVFQTHTQADAQQKGAHLEERAQRRGSPTCCRGNVARVGCSRREGRGGWRKEEEEGRYDEAYCISKHLAANDEDDASLRFNKRKRGNTE